MSKDNDDILSLMDYQDYEELYKCGECDCESWRYLVNETMICTSCHMEYSKDQFTPDC